MIAPVVALRGCGMAKPSNLLKYIKENADDFGFQPQGYPAPTRGTQPGSIQRIRVLASRVANGEPLFVEGDRIPSDRLQYIEDWDDVVHKGSKTCGCIYSGCESYRYRLWRYWDDDTTKPVACFIGLNPSDASEDQLEPTVRRVKAFAMLWGCRGFEMVNLFGLRSADPMRVFSAPDPVGTHNDGAIVDAVSVSSYAVCCWGKGGSHLHRSARVVWSLKNRFGKNRLFCFGLTKLQQSALDPAKAVGQPLHPLHLPRQAVTVELPIEKVDSDDAVV